MKKLFIISLLLSSFLCNAQIKDSIKLSIPVKFNLHLELKEGEMLDAKGDKVKYLRHIQKNIKYKDKPTLLLCWATYDLQGNKNIDALLDKKLYEKYNIVLINKNRKHDVEFIQKTNEKFHLYNEHFISLYDFQKTFNFNESQVTPMLFWLDKNFEVAASTVPPFGFKIEQIENTFTLVDSKKIVPSNIRYFNNELFPVSPEDAIYKQTITENGTTANLILVAIKNNDPVYDLNFTRNKNGDYFYIRTQNVITRETAKKETVEDIQKTLESLKGISFLGFFGSSISLYEFDGKSIKYRIEDKNIAMDYRYSLISWDKLTGIEYKINRDLHQMILTFSTPLMLETKSVESESSFPFEMIIPIPLDKKERLEKAFLLLSNMAKEEK